MLNRFICWLLGCDHDITFPKKNSLEWKFVCPRCGDEQVTPEAALEKIDGGIL